MVQVPVANSKQLLPTWCFVSMRFKKDRKKSQKRRTHRWLESLTKIRLPHVIWGPNRLKHKKALLGFELSAVAINTSPLALTLKCLIGLWVGCPFCWDFRGFVNPES